MNSWMKHVSESAGQGCFGHLKGLRPAIEKYKMG